LKQSNEKSNLGGINITRTTSHPLGGLSVGPLFSARPYLGGPTLIVIYRCLFLNLSSAIRRTLRC